MFLNYQITKLQSVAKLNTTAQKMKFSITDFFSKSDQIRSFLPIWSHLLTKSVMENFIPCAVTIKLQYNIQLKI